MPSPPFAINVPLAGTTVAFHCDLRDSKQRAICFLHKYEPQETFLFQSILKPGMTVVDIGANWGYFTLIAANLVGSSGSVLSLEPDERMFNSLQQNVAANGLSTVIMLPFAASSNECVLTLELHDRDAGEWGISRLVTGAAATSKTATVRCYSLDHLVAKHGIGTVDLVKIDVEGAEGSVLRGMASGLAQHVYRRILLELHPTFLQEPHREIPQIISDLRSLGYQGYWIDHSASVTRRMSYGVNVALSDLLLPWDSKSDYDSWPHMLWLAPEVNL